MVALAGVAQLVECCPNGKVCGFDSWSRHMPGLWVWSPVGVSARGNRSTEDVQGKNCLTNFHGTDLTHDKMCSMVKKWQTMIQAHVDIKTNDGYLLRLFCVAFAKKRNEKIRKTSYAQRKPVTKSRRR